MKNIGAFLNCWILVLGCQAQDSVPMAPGQADTPQASENASSQGDGTNEAKQEISQILDRTAQVNSVPQIDPNPPIPPSPSTAALDAIDVRIACEQVALDPTPVTGVLTIRCSALTAAGLAFDGGTAKVSSKWTFFHPSVSGDSVAVVPSGELQAPLSRADFRFPIVDSGRILDFYFADSGFYRLILTDKNNPGVSRVVEPSTVRLTGDGCGRADRLSFVLDLPRLAENSIVRRILAADDQALIVPRGARLTIDSDTNFFVILAQGQVIDQGSKAFVIALAGAQYSVTAGNKTDLILAEKTATISAGNNEILYFRSALEHCQQP